ncbi:unnamed protein product [Musa textilis]
MTSLVKLEHQPPPRNIFGRICPEDLIGDSHSTGLYHPQYDHSSTRVSITNPTISAVQFRVLRTFSHFTIKPSREGGSSYRVVATPCGGAQGERVSLSLTISSHIVI